MRKDTLEGMNRHLSELARLRNDLARLREERGATDPILIIAGIAITLILLVGGSFAISGFIGNAHNLNAKGDLDRIATAQAAYLAENDSYAALRMNISSGARTTTLLKSPIEFTPTEGLPVIVYTFVGPRNVPAWAAVIKSAGGETFARFSTSSTIYSLGDGSAFPDPAPSALVTEASSMGAMSWVQNAFERVNGR